MDIIYEIRRRHAVQKQTVTAIARDMGISRPTVRKYLNTVEESQYERVQPASPKLGQFESQLTTWLEEEAKLPRPPRRTAIDSLKAYKKSAAAAPMTACNGSSNAGNPPAMVRS